MSSSAWIRIGVAMLALLFASAASAAVPTAEITALVQAIVDEELSAGGTPGAAVAVVADGRVVASVTSGWADREAGRPVTRQTIFPVASVSKLLTATLVMRQVEQGRLDLDRAANDYLPPDRWIRDAAGEPVGSTLRQLLSHSSGLPMFSSRSEFNDEGPDRTVSEHLAEGLDAVYPPGERLEYGNESFALAGYLAAQAEGEEFEQHAQRALLRPLGMNDSSFALQEETRSQRATLYGTPFDDRAPVEPVDLSPVGPAASLHSTADDLARFALLHLGGGAVDGVRVLERESVDEMMRLRARQHPELPDGFGVGFAVVGPPERRMVFWDGAVPGATARLALLPDHDVGVAILTNSTSPRVVDAISRRVFDLLVGPVEVPPIAAAVADGDADAVGQYRLFGILAPAQWYLEPFLLLSIERRGDHLELGVPFFEGGVPLLALGSGRYRLSGVVDGATVLIEDDRLYVLLLEGQRVSPFATSTALFIYAGVFALLIVGAVGWGTFGVIRRVRGVPQTGKV